MSDILTITAEKRERAGKGIARALRREGRVPAVIYGDSKESEGFPCTETSSPNCSILAD